MQYTATENSADARRTRRNDRGISLVEVMMAVLVLGTTVAATIMVLRVGFTSIQVARDNTMAGQILQSEMENLRMMGWAELEALEEEETFSIGDQFDTQLADRYQATRRVTPDSDRPGLKAVELEVEWTTVGGVEHRRVYRTLFSKEGLNDYYYVIAR